MTRRSRHPLSPRTWRTTACWTRRTPSRETSGTRYRRSRGRSLSPSPVRDLDHLSRGSGRASGSLVSLANVAVRSAPPTLDGLDDGIGAGKGQGLLTVGPPHKVGRRAVLTVHLNDLAMPFSGTDPPAGHEDLVSDRCLHGHLRGSR